MTTTTLQKRIEKLNLSKNSLVYNWVNDLQLFGNKKEHRINCVFTQGSGWKHSSLVDKTIELSIILNRLKLKFTVNNDSPRGGRTGTHIIVLTKVV
jgi:hypothetical protein